MPDENGTATTPSTAPSADENLLGDAANKTDDTPTEVVEEENAKGSADKDPQGSDDARKPAHAEAQTDAAAELKVVISIKGGRAVIGVQQPSSDPHIETFEDYDLPTLAQEVTAVTERAMARWEDAPKHPAYERPAPPARRRNRRRQESAQTSNTGTEAAEEQQQALRLF